MTKNDKEKYDFSCCVIKYGRKSINNLIYQKDSLKDNNNVIVPLCWNHRHFDSSQVLGHAQLKNRDDGLYAYGYLLNNENGDYARQLIEGEDIWISPYVTHVVYDNERNRKYIVHGLIREVSLVVERVDPEDDYIPVLREGEK